MSSRSQRQKNRIRYTITAKGRRAMGYKVCPGCAGYFKPKGRQVYCGACENLCGDFRRHGRRYPRTSLIPDEGYGG